MIEFDHVSIAYQGDPVLRDVTATIPEGDLCLVVGRTGTGKSTLLGAINGLVPHFTGGTLRGQVTVAGRSTRISRPRDLADVVGWLGQNPLHGFVTDRVEDEIAYGMEQLGLSPSTMRKRVEETLDLMGIADLRRRPLIELSGGQQQRVAIAAVLAAQPRVLVLDEPTSALDPTAAQDVLSAIVTLVHEVGLTVVVSEHRLERVMQFADSVCWLPGDGSVVLGTPGDILRRADVQPPLARLAEAMDWPTVPLSVREARRRLVSVPVLRRVETASEPEPAEHRPRVVTSGLTVRYGDLTAVDQVSLTLDAGQITTVMGRNGAGKSSLLWALQGAVASSGSIDVAGIDPRTASALETRRHVCLVPQSADDLLYLPTVGAECTQADEESDVVAGSTLAILRSLGVDPDLDASPRDLSEGQRLALVLAIQLAAAPLVVLLDEPTRGLDYEAKDHLRDRLRALAASGVSVVVSTHDVEFAAGVSDRTLVMAGGEIVADGPTRDICTSSPAFAPQIAKVCYPAPVLTVADLDPVRA